MIGECARFRAEHYRMEGIVNFINCGCNALPLRQQQENQRRGRAFAPISLNSPRQSTFANALPSSLLSKIYFCGLGMIGECCRFRAVWGLSMNVGGFGQSITEWRELVNFINCGCNALPLRNDGKLLQSQGGLPEIFGKWR